MIKPKILTKHEVYEKGPEKKYLTTKQGYKIFYLIKRFNNNKPFVYFQHGLTGNHTVWTGQMEYMMKHKQPFIVIDLLGHGLSDKIMGRTCYTVPNQGDYIMQVLKHERINNYIVVGQCYGGMINLYNDIFHNERCKSKGLVLIGVPLRNPANLFIYKGAEPLTPLWLLLLAYIPGTVGMIFGRRRYPLINYYKYAQSSHKIIILLDLLGTPKAAYGWSLESMTKINLVPHIKKVKKPVLLVYGEGDLVAYNDIHCKMKKEFKDSKTVIIRGVDHLVTMRAPIQLSKEVIRFMEGIHEKKR